jgi:hypothetical protein
MSIYETVTPLRIGPFDVSLKFEGSVPYKTKQEFLSLSSGVKVCLIATD